MTPFGAFKAVVRFAGLTAVVVLAVPAACTGIGLVVIAGVNATYADRYYSGKVDVQDVLASRDWHPVFEARWRDCTYAIARFSEGNATEIAAMGPVAASPEPTKWRQTNRWPKVKDWSPTPLPPQSPHDDDAFLDCKGRLPETVFAEIEDILAKPGAFAIRSWTKLYVLAPQNRLIAYVRYGD